MMRTGFCGQLCACAPSPPKPAATATMIANDNLRHSITIALHFSRFQPCRLPLQAAGMWLVQEARREGSWAWYAKIAGQSHRGMVGQNARERAKANKPTGT